MKLIVCNYYEKLILIIPCLLGQYILYTTCTVYYISRSQSMHACVMRCMGKTIK